MSLSSRNFFSLSRSARLLTSVCADSAASRSDTPNRVLGAIRSVLPDPDVRGKTIVLYARRGLRNKTAWAGMFSEFHHVLGALVYGGQHGAAG